MLSSGTSMLGHVLEARFPPARLGGWRGLYRLGQGCPRAGQWVTITLLIELAEQGLMLLGWMPPARAAFHGREKHTAELKASWDGAQAKSSDPPLPRGLSISRPTLITK